MEKLKFLPFYLTSALPFPLLYFISDIAFVIVFYIIKYRRKVVKKNLLNSFPDKSRREIDDIERKFYRHLCDITFESIKFLTISKKSLNKRLRLNNLDLIKRLQKENRSVIMYTGHLGNWEWLSFLPQALSHQVMTLYKPLTNPYFDQLMKITRSRFGVICVEANKGYKTIIKQDQENIVSLNCIVGDQCPRSKDAMQWTRFLNQDTAFLIGADKIAKRSNQPLVFPFFRKPKRGFYEVTYELIEEFPQESEDREIIRKYVRILENNINQSPELYLWSHKRWKLAKPKDVVVSSSNPD